MSSIDNYPYKKQSTLQRPKTLQRSQSSIKKSNINISTKKYHTLKIDCNTSNNHLTRKPSFRQKIFSIFKTYSKPPNHSFPNDISVTSDENNGKSNITSHNKQRSFHRSKHVDIEDHHQHQHQQIERLDSRDILLIDKFFVHRLNAEIINFISEPCCSPIRLPTSWVDKFGLISPLVSCVPGLQGMDNHGNSCYINVIVQCLAHIDSVAEYFSTKDYLQQVTVTIDHQSTSASAAIGGESATAFDVLVAFGYVVQSLWQMTYDGRISQRFCQLLALHKSAFGGDSQQDAHELLLCLLNLLHDNLARKADTATLSEDPMGSISDGLEGQETSFIYERFRGWLSNVIACPQCRYASRTLDQTLSLNLQIPGNTVPQGGVTKPSAICHVVVVNANQVAERHALQIDSTTTITNVRQSLADRLACDKMDVVVMELVATGFGRLYSNNDEVMNICKRSNNFQSDTTDIYCDGLYATCIPNQVVDVDALQISALSENDMTNMTKTQKSFPDNQSFIRILVVHVERTKELLNEYSDDYRRIIRIDDTTSRTSSLHEQDLFSRENHYRRFTNILTVQAARKTKISLLRHSLSEQMFKYLNLRNISKLPKPQFIIGGSHLVSEFDLFPLTHKSVSEDLQYSMELCGEESAHVRLVVVWPPGTMEKLKMYKRKIKENMYDSRSTTLNSHRISNHASVEELAMKFDKANSELEQERNIPQKKINITDCLRESFSLDSPSITESWKCPNCQTSQPARTEIRIAEAPEILIIMLKRFSRQQGKSTEYLFDKRNQSPSEQIRKHTSNQAFSSVDYKLKNGMFPKTYSVRSREGLNKLEGLVDYPLKDLDLKPYMENALEDQDYLYDLVGVVNHRGSLFNGHYVAICHNSVDNRWRLYDDDRVTEIQASEVVQPDAYILFYKRQTPPLQTNPDLNLHWSYRRLKFPEKIHRSHSPSPTSMYGKHRRNTDKPSTRSADSYSTLPLSITNNHSSKLHPRRPSGHSSIPFDPVSILSPHIALSDLSLVSSNRNCHMVEPGDIVDISKIRSEIIDVDSLSFDLSMLTEAAPPKTSSPNDSSCGRSLNEDSGTALSQDSSCPTERRHLHSSMHNNSSKDECYNSLSTSPATSSPSTSHTY